MNSCSVIGCDRFGDGGNPSYCYHHKQLYAAQEPKVETVQNTMTHPSDEARDLVLANICGDVCTFIDAQSCGCYRRIQQALDAARDAALEEAAKAMEAEAPSDSSFYHGIANRIRSLKTKKGEK